MIYITNDTRKIGIPKVMFGIPKRLYFENQISHKVWYIDNLIDRTPDSTIYTFNYERASYPLTDGQYTYKLVDAKDEVLSTGIMQFGDFVPNNDTYKVENNVKIYRYNN